ncbi:MAG TPA: hypothetical protein EYQ21_05055 [Flavobacteriales bacterium]|nr:hypothetical protein [Flavobacteriales bacterium]
MISDAEHVKMYESVSFEFSYDKYLWLSYDKFFSLLDKEFNFTLDVCATKKNTRCAKFYTFEDDGLAQDWTGEVVYCSPWYDSDTIRWVIKCAASKNTSVMMVHYEPEDIWWQNTPGAVVRELRCRVNAPGYVTHHIECGIAVLIYKEENAINKRNL